MTNNKQDHIVEANKIVTAVEQFAIALYEKGLLIGNGDEIQELLEQAKLIERQRIENAYDDAVQDMRQDEERPFKGSEYYDNNFLTPKQAIGQNFDADAQEIFQGD